MQRRSANWCKGGRCLSRVKQRCSRAAATRSCWVSFLLLGRCTNRGWQLPHCSRSCQVIDSGTGWLEGGLGAAWGTCVTQVPHWLTCQRRLALGACTLADRALFAGVLQLPRRVCGCQRVWRFHSCAAAQAGLRERAVIRGCLPLHAVRWRLCLCSAHVHCASALGTPSPCATPSSHFAGMGVCASTSPTTCVQQMRMAGSLAPHSACPGALVSRQPHARAARSLAVAPRAIAAVEAPPSKSSKQSKPDGVMGQGPIIINGQVRV